MDCGPHFRCSEMIHYLFKELKDLQIKISLNFFCERHGKNERDRHFSSISYFIKRESLVRKLTSTQDICDAIMKQQDLANSFKEIITKSKKKAILIKNLQRSNTVAFVIPMHSSQSVVKKRLKVIGLRRFYNLFTDHDFILKTHIMSDSNETLTIHPLKESEKNERIEKWRNKRDKVETVAVNSLTNKIKNWKKVQNIVYSSESDRDMDESVLESDEEMDAAVPESDEEMDTDENILASCYSKCSECKAEVKYNGENIKTLKLVNVLKELHEHGHPKSRQLWDKKKSKKINRNLIKAKEELLNHYKKFHK